MTKQEAIFAEFQKIDDAVDKLAVFGVVRARRLLAGYFAEWWAAVYFGIKLADNTGQKDYDAVDRHDRTYQIKSRRVPNLAKCTSFDFKRRPDCDFLIAVFLEERRMRPLAAYLFPREIVNCHAVPNKNCFKFRWASDSEHKYSEYKRFPEDLSGACTER